MPLDGLSSSNTGMYRFITPTENIMQAEHAAKVQSEQGIKKTEKGEAAKNNLSENSDDEQRDLQGRDSSENEQTSENGQGFVTDEENLKKYKVKFNSSTEMVEFIDRNTGSVIENMSPEDLLGLVSKSLKPSGILVDREI